MTAFAEDVLRRGRASPHAAELPRLLAGLAGRTEPVTLAEHTDRWGRLPLQRGLLGEVAASGLRGHGGAWFPVADKWKAVGARRLGRPVVVANGAEGEPASRKDAVLLSLAPHLVLDGAVAAAAALGASRIVVYPGARSVGVLEAALAERRRAGIDPVPFEIMVAPSAFLAGQESAAVNVINGRDRPAPSFSALETVRDRGVAGRPTLVHNVETLAHVALVARFGAAWYGVLGHGDDVGSLLLTVTGRWAQPTVLEVAAGSSLAGALQLAPGDLARYRGVLLGGYGGAWVPTSVLGTLPLSEPAVRRARATLGAGVVCLLPADACPLREVAFVVTYLEAQGAGQCGPCVNGLGELAAAVRDLASGGARSRRAGLAPILELCDLVDGRGACRHPDGVARFVRSALGVFADDAAAHLRTGPCRPARDGVLPLPRHASAVHRGGGR